MQEIVLCKLENWKRERDASEPCVAAGASGVVAAPQIIVGPPCEELRELQAAGCCVLAELAHLQGMSEEAVAEALCKEEAVPQFENVCIHAGELPQAYLRRIWCKAQGQPVLIAETGRLLIRESMQEDAAAFLELYEDNECRKYLEAPPVTVDAQSVIGQNGLGQKGSGWQEAVFKDNRSQLMDAYRRYIAEYCEGQYAFYEYGMWTVVEKESGAVVGRAGLELQECAGEKPELQDCIGERPELQGCAGEKPELQECTEAGLEPTSQSEPSISLGYAVLPKFRGKGYAAEACAAILEYCRECGYADKVIVKIDAENAASRKVFEKLKESQKYGCVALELILR